MANHSDSVLWKLAQIFRPSTEPKSLPMAVTGGIGEDTNKEGGAIAAGAGPLIIGPIVVNGSSLQQLIASSTGVPSNESTRVGGGIGQDTKGEGGGIGQDTNGEGGGIGQDTKGEGGGPGLGAVVIGPIVIGEWAAAAPPPTKQPLNISPDRGARVALNNPGPNPPVTAPALNLKV